MPRDESFVERIVQNVESRVEQWRKEDAARKNEVEQRRDALQEEATEREKLLAQAIGEEEDRGLSSREAAIQHGAVFVAHSEETGKVLEELAGDRARLERVIPGRSHADTGVQGSWLLFERF